VLYLNDDGKRRKRAVSLKQDVQQLAVLLKAYPNVRLIVIDPISAYMGGIDTHRNSEMRSSLMELKDLASEHRIAILAVMHLNKEKNGKTNALYRVQESIVFTALARAVYVVTKDYEDEERRLMLRLKHNLSP
jgi:RecA-family ATPase